MTPLLSARGLAVERGDRPLLQNVSLSVFAGQVWQLVGANGMGKTSLLRALSGLARLGVTGDIQRHAPLLYLGHSAALKLSLTATENLRFHPACETSAQPGEIASALAAVNLRGYEDRPVSSLSAGQQRRVALARLVLSPAALWLLDEPFTALDAAGCDWLEHRVREHVAEQGAVVFTSHQASRFGGLQQDMDLSHHVV